MSKRIVRAAQATPKPSDHPDAEIFALAEQCSEAGKALDEAEAALERAQERCRHTSWPDVLRRTDRDRELGLFVGKGSTVYCSDDVPALRALVRRHHVAESRDSLAAWNRAKEILDALRSLKDEEEREGPASGLTEAKRRHAAARDVLDHLAERLAQLPAVTIGGVFAKARVARRAFLEENTDLAEHFEAKFRKRLHILGPDDGSMALSLARDVIRLADREEVR